MKTVKQIITIFLALTFVSCVFAAIPVSGAKQYTVSEEGISLIKRFEGFNEYAYWDYSHYSIGYGTKCNSSDYPNGITESEATLLLRNNIDSYEKSLDGFLEKYGITVNQNQYDALVSITYNIGAGLWTKNADFELRTILINGFGNYTEQQIRDGFGQFCRAGGEVLSGLVRRRNAEAELFLAEEYTLFSDVRDSAWYFSYVKSAYEKGLFKGTGNLMFSPETPINKAMAATVLTRVVQSNNLQINNTDISTAPSNLWYSDSTEWAWSRGYFSVFSVRAFSPFDVMTRQELITMLYGFALDYGFASAGTKRAEYKDANRISSYAGEAMRWAVSNGIICGNDEGYLMPEETVSRSECAVIMIALMNIIQN